MRSLLLHHDGVQLKLKLPDSLLWLTWRWNEHFGSLCCRGGGYRSLRQELVQLISTSLCGRLVCQVIPS